MPKPTPGRSSTSCRRTPDQGGEEEFAEGTHDEVVNRIGNLTLLEAGLNKAVGNGTFADKLKAYGESKYALTTAIPEMAPEVWTRPILEHRQRQLAARAVHLWRADFD